MTKRVPIWSVWGIAVAAGAALMIDVAVEGVGKAASGPAGIVVAACELGALALAITATVKEGNRREAAGAKATPSPSEADSTVLGAQSASHVVVDARAAQGVQVGNRGVQTNFFGSARSGHRPIVRPPAHEPTRTPAHPTVDVRGSQGLQVGDGAAQHNAFGDDAYSAGEEDTPTS